MPRLSDRTVDIVLLAAAFFFALGAVIALAGDRSYASQRCDGPGRYDAMRDGADCSNPPQTTAPCGIVVWEGHPHCHAIAEQTSACAPGYEQLCDARDHGAHPYQPYGGSNR